MEELLNEDTQADTPQVRNRKKARRQIVIPLPEFLSHIGEDVRWYYDVRLWSPLILLLLILALLPGKAPEAAAVVQTEPVIAEAEPLPPEETEAEPEPIDPNAAALATLAESVGEGRSDNVKLVIMWVAINRSEDRANGYGLSLIDEIGRENQWQNYAPNSGYSEHTYELAMSVLETIRSGGLRPLEGDMLWFVLNDNGSISVRNQFLAGTNGKWVERTIR